MNPPARPRNVDEILGKVAAKGSENGVQAPCKHRASLVQARLIFVQARKWHMQKVWVFAILEPQKFRPSILFIILER